MLTLPRNTFASLGRIFADSSCSWDPVPDTVYLDVEKWDLFAHNPITISLLRSMFFRPENVQASRPGLKPRSTLRPPFGRARQCRIFITVNSASGHSWKHMPENRRGI